jgi:hypothetical protein
VLFDNDITLLRLEIIVKRPAPRIFGKRLALVRAITVATDSPSMTPPSGTGFAYDFRSSIRPRM